MVHPVPAHPVEHRVHPLGLPTPQDVDDLLAPHAQGHHPVGAQPRVLRGDVGPVHRQAQLLPELDDGCADPPGGPGE